MTRKPFSRQALLAVFKPVMKRLKYSPEQYQAAWESAVSDPNKALRCYTAILHSWKK